MMYKGQLPKPWVESTIGRSMDVKLNHPAKEVKAAVEKLTKPHSVARMITSHTALTGVCV
jgi:hypothetical protein